MALPPTRLILLLSRIGPDPLRLTHALQQGYLLKQAVSPQELDRVLTETLDQVAEQPPHPGPTWADRLSATLQQGGYLNSTGKRWASSNYPPSRLTRFLILLIGGWWGLAGSLSAVLMIEGDNSSGLIPTWLGYLVLGFGLSAAAATLGVWRRASWAAMSVRILTVAGVLLIMGMGLAVAPAVSTGKALASSLLATPLFVASCLMLARYVQREHISAG